MSMESHGGMILTEETEELGEKPVPLPLCPLQVPRGLTRAYPGLCGERPVTNRLSHGTASSYKLLFFSYKKSQL
jgi:hypothetical protein